MPKGHVAKLIRSHNGVLNLVKMEQQSAKLELVYEENPSNYKEAFNNFIKVFTYAHKVAGKYTININGLSESELMRLKSHLE